MATVMAAVRGIESRHWRATPWSHYGDTGKHVDMLRDERKTNKARCYQRDIAEVEIEGHCRDKARAYENCQTDDKQETRDDKREQSRARLVEVSHRIAGSL
jgi:hypothetical protein